MRNKIKKYIDEADEHAVKMDYSMHEADTEHDWWDGLPKKTQLILIKHCEHYEKEGAFRSENS